MSLWKHTVFVIFMILMLLCVSEAQKNKNKGGGKKSGSGGKKNKGKGKGGGGGAQFKPDPDKVYWSSGGHDRAWRESDDPLKNEYFMGAYRKLVDTLSDGETPIKKLTVEQLMNNVTQNANWFKSVEEVHEMLTGSVVLWNEYTEIYGAIFAIHLDTDGGQDLPPIINSYCTVSECLYRGSKYSQNPDDPGYFIETRPYDQEEVYRPPRSSSGTLLDDLLSRWEHLTEIFAVEDVKEMVCQEEYATAIQKSVEWVEGKFENKEKQKFVKDPDSFSRFGTERHLGQLFELQTARMLGHVVSNLCGEDKETGEKEEKEEKGKKGKGKGGKTG